MCIPLQRCNLGVLQTHELLELLDLNLEDVDRLVKLPVRRETGHTHKHTTRRTLYNTRHAKNNTTNDHTKNHEWEGTQLVRGDRLLQSSHRHARAQTFTHTHTHTVHIYNTYIGLT